MDEKWAEFGAEITEDSFVFEEPEHPSLPQCLLITIHNFPFQNLFSTDQFQALCTPVEVEHYPQILRVIHMHQNSFGLIINSKMHLSFKIINFKI